MPVWSPMVLVQHMVRQMPGAGHKDGWMGRANCLCLQPMSDTGSAKLRGCVWTGQTRTTLSGLCLEQSHAPFAAEFMKFWHESWSLWIKCPAPDTISQQAARGLLVLRHAVSMSHTLLSKGARIAWIPRSFWAHAVASGCSVRASNHGMHISGDGHLCGLPVLPLGMDPAR